MDVSFPLWNPIPAGMSQNSISQILGGVPGAAHRFEQLAAHTFLMILFGKFDENIPASQCVTVCSLHIDEIKLLDKSLIKAQTLGHRH